MIDEGLQAEIRATYQELTDSLNLVPRWGQRQMIAEVANALADPEAETPIAVVEAGTGTGKTIAYLVAALPIARARGKKLVVASATVALQEQLLLRDLPDVMQHSGLNFDAALAKGRGRYVCLLKLDHQLSDHGADPLIPLYPDEFLGAGEELAGPILDEMIQALGDGSWMAIWMPGPSNCPPASGDSSPPIKANARAEDVLILASAVFFAPARVWRRRM